MEKDSRLHQLLQEKDKAHSTCWIMFIYRRLFTSCFRNIYSSIPHKWGGPNNTNKCGVGRGVGTLGNKREGRGRRGRKTRGRRIVNFDKIKRKGLFVNEIQFYH